MAQETLYFPHDYNPFEDRMYEALIFKHSTIGHAVYWRLVEMLHANTDHILPLEPYVYRSVANKFSITPEDVETVIEDCISEFRLFVATNGVFWSERVNKNIAKRKELSEKNSRAGKESAKKRKHLKELESKVNSIMKEMGNDFNIGSTPVEHMLNTCQP